MAMPVTTASLQKAFDSRNWVAVKDLLDDRHASKDVIEKSGLLHKLVTRIDISLTLMEDIVDKICSHHVDINSLDEEGMGVLHRLCQLSYTNLDDILLLLLNKGADINLRNIDNDTPLDVAAKHGKWQMVIPLLKQGAKENVTNKEKKTVSHVLSGGFSWWAILFKNDVENILQLLKNSSLDIDATDCHGNTALYVAVRRGQILILEKLLTLGARADFVDVDGRTVLHIMATQTYEYSSSLLMQIVNCGAKLDIKDCEGNTAFHLASIHENWHFLEMFTDTFVSKTDDNHIKYFLSDELHAAVEERRWNVVKWMVKYSTDINKTDSQGRTLLQRLAQLNPDENVDDAFSLLVDRVADFAVRTQEGENLLQLSVRHNNWLVAERLVRMVDLIITSPQAGSILNMAAKAQEWSSVRLLVEMGADVDSQDPDGNTVLHVTAKMNNWSFVAYLLKKGAHAKLADSEGHTVLHRCISFGRKTFEKQHQDYNIALNLILNSDVDVTIQDPEGNLAIHLAAMNGNMDLVSRLINTPVNLDLRDSEGFTLLMRASDICSHVAPNNNITLKVINHLLDSGVDTEARSPDGLTAFGMAVQCNNWPTILALLPRCEAKIGDNVSLRRAQYLHRLAIQEDICDEKLRSFTKTLLAHGLDINEVDSHGHSPLTSAVKRENWNYVILLLQHGAEANVTVNKKSLLHFISSKHRGIRHSVLTALLDALQARGVDFNRQDNGGQTLLFKYEVFSSVCYEQDSSRSYFRLLVDRGANLLLPDCRGHSLLRLSLDVNGDFGLRFLKFLVTAGVTTHQPALTKAARPSSRIFDAPSPTKTAFKWEDVQALKILIESGASSNGIV